MKVIFADSYNLALNMYEGVPISRAVKPWRWWFTVCARVVWLLRMLLIPMYFYGTRVSVAVGDG
jgi:fatty acid desaturase (delta-4 desaturase)